MKNKIFYLPKFQEPAGTLPGAIPDFLDWSKMSDAERFQVRMSPLHQFVQTVSSDQGKQNSQYSGNYYWTKTKDNPQEHWVFIRSEEPLKPMEQEIVEYLPGTGDVAEVVNIGKDLSQGNIGNAMLAAGLLILPGNIGKAVRRTGDDAVDMFRTYNKMHSINIPQNSELYPEIQKLIPEARKRYELIDNMDISDEEIAKALYGRAQELGFDTAAKYSTGEPHLLFRGDTQRYEQLKDRWSPEKVAENNGTMDNSLGNLFLGEFPNSVGEGIDRYIGTLDIGSNFLKPSATGSSVILPNGQIIKTGIQIGSDVQLPFKKIFQKPLYSTRKTTRFQLPDDMMISGVNDINSFIVRTPKVRDSSFEISVLNDDRLPMGLKLKTGTIMNNYLGGFKGKRFGKKFDGPFEHTEFRINTTAPHYIELLNRAKKKGQGLLFSDKVSPGRIHPLRNEHGNYTYWVLPNFNRKNAKHLFGYDITQPVNWNIDNIYLKEGGKLNEDN